MIDHVGLVVRDYAKSKAFFEKALAPLGYKLVMEFDAAAGIGYVGGGFGAGGKPDLWIEQESPPHKEVHVAFAAPDRKAVDAFHAAALAAGGKDNGKPGPRAEYHPGYYGAFVLDPDGNNIEAVCHRPE
jgi:catechol 2,3-dioxygenase-like lactoylglutathione lyase family enzyme